MSSSSQHDRERDKHRGTDRDREQLRERDRIRSTTPDGGEPGKQQGMPLTTLMWAAATLAVLVLAFVVALALLRKRPEPVDLGIDDTPEPAIKLATMEPSSISTPNQANPTGWNVQSGSTGSTGSRAGFAGLDPLPKKTPTPTELVTKSVSSEKRGFRAEVLHPSDGSRLLVRREGERMPTSVQLIGVDAPHRSSRDKEGQEPWGARSQQFLSLMVTRKNVFVELDVEEKCSDGQTLWAYLWLDGVLVNERMLAAGHAMLATRPPNVKYVERLTLAQQSARAQGIGVWNPAEPLDIPPSQFVPRPLDKQPTDPANKKPQPKGVKVEDYPDQLAQYEPNCVIGNRESKIYRLPSDTGYEKSQTSRNAIFFRTQEAAEKAGYRRIESVKKKIETKS